MNSMKIPVPVPLQTMTQVLDWIENTLVKDGQVLTKVILNGQDVFENNANKNCEDIIFDEKSVLSVRIESPRDLAIQLLESINKLARGMFAHLKPVAVKCWQGGQSSLPLREKLNEIYADITLCIELVEHLCGIVDPTHIEAAPVQGISILLQKAIDRYRKCIDSGDLQNSARVLLNQFEPLLEELMKESENLQMQVFASPLSDQTGSLLLVK
ncbi:MAG: hypothetical protein R3B45_01455 [Bdellovibrionota bacterium]